jgi:hypothetical protein
MTFIRSFAGNQVQEAVVDVVHAHDRRGGARGLGLHRFELLRCGGLDHADELGVAGGDRGGECGHPQLRLREARRALRRQH